MANTLHPISAEERVFAWRDHASLWFSLGVGLLVVQTGAFLVPATGTIDALLAVIFGSIIGAGLLAWVARIACATGLSSAGLMHLTFGRSFARLPVLLNVVQLIGWTTFELVIMRDGTLSIYRHSVHSVTNSPAAIIIATLLWGAILLLLLSGSMITLVRRIISHVALPLVVLSLLWLTWQFGAALTATNLSSFLAKRGDGSMSFLAAIDLVIAMPISWLPLVSDYARHGKISEKHGANAAFYGTFFGYILANIWCYGLGVIIASNAAAGADMLGTLLLAQGGLVALGFILFDELDNTYGDVYSGSVSAHSIWPRWSIKKWGIILAIACIIFAFILPMNSLEPFLLLLSSVFVPLFGIILGHLGKRQTRTQFTAPPINISTAVIWIFGVIFFHAWGHWLPQWGSALPTLILTSASSRLIRSTSQYKT